MAVDPHMQEILDFIASRGVLPHYKLSPAEARINMLKSRTVLGGERVEIARVEDRRIPGPAGEIPVRVYAGSESGPLPVLVFYHGGGWVMGDLETHDDLCRRLALESGCLVMAVDYRLAPEHRFPAAAEDAWAALNWAGVHAGEMGGDATRLAVGGDSAGGNLSAVVALQARDAGSPNLRMQLLVYPVVTQDFSTGSMRDNAEGYLLTQIGMRWFWDHYLNRPHEAQDLRASPAQAESLAGLPPAYLVTTELDPLRDEGIAYGQALRAAGVPVTHVHEPGLIHGYLTMTVMERARSSIAAAGAALRTAMG